MTPDYQLIAAQPETRTSSIPLLIALQLPSPIPVMGNHQSRTRESMSDKPDDSRKRRSRMLSSASTAVTPETTAEGTSANAEEQERMERPRRASRVLSSIKDGFRRSASTRDVALRPPIARGSSVQDAAAITEQENEEGGEQVHSRQDKKRRRIGDYAGPSASSSSTDVSVSNSQILLPQHEITPPKPPTPPLLSPPLVPLTTSDPLLDDRLRSLEAIRSVLGDEVARRLPSVESLRELSAQQAPAGGVQVPESTRELLGELDREPTEAGTTISETPEVLSDSTASMTQQRERRDRRASIRNFTNRLGGWLGVGQGRGEGVPESGAMEVDAAETRNESQHAEQETAQQPAAPEAEASTSTPAGTAPPTRIAQGAVMIVQGFVQTTVPPRERRRSRPPTASISSPPVTASRLGMRRTMSHPGPSSAASSISPSGVSDLLSPPPPSARSPHSSDPSSVMEPLPRMRAGSATPHDTGRWAPLPVDEGTIASPARSSRGVNRPGTPVVPEVGAGLRAPVVPTDHEGAGGRRERDAAARVQSGTEERRGGEREGRGEPPSFAEQARMLGGLLSVATAATATSLLSQGTQATTGETTTNAARARSSGPRAALEALRNRLRSSSRTTSTEAEGAPVPDRGVEDVLREYMRHAMANSRNASRSAAEGAPTVPMLSTILPTTDPESFEAFLNDMQTELIQALTVFAGEQEEAEASGSGASVSGAETTTAEARETPAAGDQEATQQAPASTTNEPAEPRRLNFFRIFQFPARPNPPAQPSDPAVDLIPVVIVGVRSMTRDINTVTAENVAAAPFPFNHTDNIQGSRPEQEEGSAPVEDAVEAPATSQSATEQPAPAETPSGSWGSRALRSIGRLRRSRAGRTTNEASEADEEFTRNYVLWVVGGNYPAGHPILTMPHLFTGELSHEDLWILAEALGQVKPPVASRADIENSGLAVIKGSQVKDEGASGAILAICVEQCLICLAEYEDEAESDVRVMSCKHAFHKSCVDEWMVVGRNSCPACRQTGVETASAREASAQTTDAPAPTQNEDVNMAS